LALEGGETPRISNLNARDLQTSEKDSNVETFRLNLVIAFK